MPNNREPCHGLSVLANSSSILQMQRTTPEPLLHCLTMLPMSIWDRSEWEGARIYPSDPASSVLKRTLYLHDRPTVLAKLQVQAFFVSY